MGVRRAYGVDRSAMAILRAQSRGPTTLRKLAIGKPCRQRQKRRRLRSDFPERGLMRTTSVSSALQLTKFHHHPAHGAGTLFGDVRLASATDIRWASLLTRS